MDGKRRSDLEMAEMLAEKVREKKGTAYFVGGFVRDSMLGLPNKDVDIEVHGLPEKELKEILKDMGSAKLVGASFGVFKLSGCGLDISLPRSERATGTGHRDFDVSTDPFMGVEKAASRRDFTMNAIMKDILTGEIVDPFGGVEDIERGIIRHVNDDAFTEDPLRVFRAAQFSARFGFSVDEKTMSLMREVDLRTLSRERVWEELEKALMKGKEPGIFFRVLSAAGQLDSWFPEFTPEKKALSLPEMETAMRMANAASKEKGSVKVPRDFLVAAVCTPVFKESGAAGVGFFLKRLNPDVSLRRYVLNTIECSKELLEAFDAGKSGTETNRIFDVTHFPEDAIKLAVLMRADELGKSAGKEAERWLDERLGSFRELTKTPEVMGRDLISLGMAPGEKFGQILKEAHEKYLAGKKKEEILEEIIQAER